MKNKYLTLIIGIFLIGLVSAVGNCTLNNDFTQDDDFVVCSSDCQYQRPTNLSQYLDCDGNITCQISIAYPNFTIFVTDEDMTLNSAHYEYNLSAIMNSTPEGVYPSRVQCQHTEHGWSAPVDFYITMGTETHTYTGGGGGGGRTGLTAQVISEDPTITWIKDNWIAFLIISILLIFAFAEFILILKRRSRR